MQVKCKTCRKTPRNCRCFEYRLEIQDNGEVWLFVDNVATEPVRGQEVGTWQTRRNSKVYRRPQFVDGYGPIAIITHRRTLKQIKEAIANDTFFADDFEKAPGVWVSSFDRERRRRLPFLRRPRKRTVRSPVG